MWGLASCATDSPAGRTSSRNSPTRWAKRARPTWQPSGGHRVWIAPEDPVKSYAPDNDPVAIEVQGDEIACTGPVEALTGMEKKITVKMAASGTGGGSDPRDPQRRRGALPIWRRGS